MNIVNVIEIIKGIPNRIESFPIWEEQLSEEVVEKVEKLFLELIEKKYPRFIEDEFQKEDILDDGYFDDDNGYYVCIIWSEIS